MEQETLLGGEQNEAARDIVEEKHHSQSSLPTIIRKIYALLLCLSLCVNGFLVYLLAQRKCDYQEVSAHASLSRNIIEPYYEETRYSNHDDASLTAHLWHEIDIDSGVIALSDDYVASKGLLPAQRFPWDATKGVYIIHGYHNLHCLKIIYISMTEYHLNEPQSRKWHHISHCFDALRRQIQCDADDTPRAVQRELDGVSGVGQDRQCRDWSKLAKWAKEHTACYKRPERPVEGMRNIEKYKFCPKGSEYEVSEDLA